MGVGRNLKDAIPHAHVVALILAADGAAKEDGRGELVGNGDNARKRCERKRTKVQTRLKLSPKRR